MEEMGISVLLFYACALGSIPGFIAWKKGHSFYAWWVFGAILWIVALPVSILIRTDQASLDIRRLKNGERRCRSCKEFVRGDAIICPHCRNDIPVRSESRGSTSFDTNNFPKGTTLFETTKTLVAVLPDGSVLDANDSQGEPFASIVEYRMHIGDRDEWREMKKL